MKVFIDDSGKRIEAQALAAQTVLDVLQAQRVYVQATCGGVGKCRRRQVLVRDDQGLSYRLACTTPAVDGMEVVVERAGAMEVLQSGATRVFPPDEGAAGLGMAADIGTTTVVGHLHDAVYVAVDVLLEYVVDLHVSLLTRGRTRGSSSRLRASRTT